jgi:hypothetical protein
MANGEKYLDAIRSELRNGHRQWKRGDKLLEAFGYTRRRQTAIDLINSRLEAKSMYTVPTLTTEMPLDRGITFYLKGTKPESQATTPVPTEENAPVEVIELASGDDGEIEGKEAVKVTIAQEPPIAEPGSSADRSLIVGNLACAERIPEQISPSATVKEALTKMALHDYSQLVVTTGPRDIKGIISYKSVAQAYLQGEPKTVGDCLDENVPQVELTLRVVCFNEYSAVLIIRTDKTLQVS